MGSRGPLPKDPKLRKRKNIQPEFRQLPTAQEASKFKVPELHKRDDGVPWHKAVKEWWTSIWKSPMSSQWLDSDIKGGLRQIANLYQILWTPDTSQTMRLAMLSEIRMQESRFGLSPDSRTRMRWEISRAEEAEAKAAGKRQPPAKPSSDEDDPRVGLKLV